MLLSEWYPLLKEFTFETKMIPLQQEKSEIDKAIESTIQKWGPVFVRLDQQSPKHFEPCKNPKQVWQCLKVPRTEPLLATSKFLCLRRWVSFEKLIELRCFLHCGLTGISQNDAQKDSKPMDNPKEMKKVAIDFIESITNILPDHCTVDLAFDEDIKVFVVGVNSSFLDRAGSGLFDLDNPADEYQLKKGQGKIIFRYYSDIFYGLEEC